MNEGQINVINWWYNGRDYREGILLLSRYSKKRMLINTLIKNGKEKFQANHDKLQYELPKAVQLNYKEMPSPGAAVMKKPGNKIPEKKELRIHGSGYKKSDNNEAVKIRSIRHLRSELYTKRSLLHKQLRKSGDENTPTKMEQRASLLSEIKEISAKMDYYWEFLDHYEKTGRILKEEKPPAETSKSDSSEKSVDEIKKDKKNLQSNNTKDRNQLLYQQKNKAKNPNPMPEGPKRIKIETRISRRLKQINYLDSLLQTKQNA